MVQMSMLLLERPGFGPLMLGLSIALLLGLTLISEPGKAHAGTQAVGDRWVILATRTIDTKAGRATVDLKRAKGAFKAVRLTVKAGAMALTRLELKLSDGTVVKVRRSLILHEDQQTPPLGVRAEDAFLDSIALAFRSAAGELDHVTVEISGLQSPRGAVAVRGAPPEQPATDATSPDKPTAGAPRMGEEGYRRPPQRDAGRKRAPETESRPTIATR